MNQKNVYWILELVRDVFWIFVDIINLQPLRLLDFA